MKILYVVSRPLEINTSASIRNRATIQGLIELGHSVDLITSKPDKNHSNYDDSTKIDGLITKYLKLGGIQKAANFGRKYKILQSLKSLIYNYLEHHEIYDNLKTIVKHANKIDISEMNYDIVISSSDPKSSHLFVKELIKEKLNNNINWIQIWGDPFLTDITRQNKKFDKKIKREENKLLDCATKVVYVSKPTLIQQKETYPKHADKMSYAPIPYVKEEIYSNVDLSKKSILFLYCGDYSSKVRDIKPLYNAIKDSKHKLIICGHSDLNLESTDRIKVYPRVSFEKTKEFEKKCDVLVHLSNLSGTQIPGKIYQYSGTNKPILFILDGKREILLETFKKYDRYIFSDNNILDIHKQLRSIITSEFDNTFFVEKSFSPIKISSEIINLI